MNDGRLFTDHNTSSMLNKQILLHNNLANNEEYRKYLVDNANKIIDMNKKSYMTQNNTYYANNDPLHVLNMKEQDTIIHIYLIVFMIKYNHMVLKVIL